MPMHNWKSVAAGTYHNFHQLLSSSLTNRLNAGVLPRDFFAMQEQIIGGPEPDVIALELRQTKRSDWPSSEGGVAVLEPRAKPKTRVVMMTDEDRYARKADRIVIRHAEGDVRAIIELVSPGNKSSIHALRSLIDKLSGLLRSDINLLVVDPFPPSRRDPHGVHALLWSEFSDEVFELPADRPLTLAAYQAQPIRTAYIEPFAVGMPLPTMPLFLVDDFYVDVPLEETYQATWNALPEPLRRSIESAQSA